MALADISTPLDGYKTWIAIIGAFGLGISQLSQKNWDAAALSFTTAFGLIGALHRAERVRKEAAEKDTLTRIDAQAVINRTKADLESKIAQVAK